MSPLLRLSLLTGLHRLRSDLTFSLFALMSLALAGVLCSLSGAWLLRAANPHLPYHDPDRLWFVQLQHSRFSASAYGPEMQASARLVDDFVHQQHAFEAIGLAESRAFRLGGRGERRIAMTIPGLSVDESFWSTLGVRPAYGRFGRPDSNEAVVGHDWAQAHYSSPEAALGSFLELDGDPYHVVGVLGRDFVPPMSFAELRRKDIAPEIYVPARTNSAREAPDMAKVMLVVGRSNTAPAIIESASNAYLANAGATADRGFRIGVRPLARHMVGADARFAAILFAAAALLAFTAIVGLGMLASGRFLARAANQHVALALGARPTQETLFEKVETGLLLAGAFLAALAGLVAAVAILALSGVAGSGLFASLLPYSVAFLVVYFALAGAVLAFAILRGRGDPEAGLGASRNMRGASRSGMHGLSYRILLAIQTLIALAVVSGAFAMLGQGWNAARAAFAGQFSGLVAWNIEFPEATPGDRVAAELARLKRTALASASVEGAAIVLARPLDLVGSTISYHGPRILNGTVLSNKDGVSIIRTDSPQPGSGGPAEVSYVLSVVAAEPAFLSMMGYRLEAGRAYADAEQNAVLLTGQASDTMFKGYRTVVGEIVPGKSKASEHDLWHNNLRVAGVVGGGRVADANTLGSLTGNIPVAFVPYRDIVPDGTYEATILLRKRDPDGPPLPMLERLLSQSAIPGLRGQTSVLQQEVRQRLARHFIASLGTLVVGLVVLLSACVGALGSIKFNCQRRIAEIGVRLALGAKERQILVLLARQELMLPAALALLWWLSCAAASPLMAALGRSSPLDWQSGLAAAAIVLATLLAGFLAGVSAPVRKAPMDALRSE